MWTPILAILGSLVGMWAVFKYVILLEARVDSNTFKTLYELSKNELYFLIQEEFITEAKYPNTFKAVCWFKGAPFFFLNHGERMLQAGWQSKDSVTMITCLRWRYRSLKNYFSNQMQAIQLKKFGVPVQLITPYYTDRIGSIKKPIKTLYGDYLYKDVLNEVEEVFCGNKEKLGVLFYGPPGNGKTTFVKYIGTQYKVPIKIVTFSPDFTNHDIMLMFSQITSNCIVLFEDFDNYFDGRKCIVGSENIKFTFDTILNGLDGVYNSYENVVFIMTANDINKIDYALKNRPSRFKFVRKLKNPPSYERMKHIPKEWIEMTEGLNLDQVLCLKEYYKRGCGLLEAMKKLDKVSEKRDKAVFAAR